MSGTPMSTHEGVPGACAVTSVMGSSTSSGKDIVVVAPWCDHVTRHRRVGDSGRAQDQAARRYPGAGGDEDVLDVGHLVDARAADLADAFGDPVHPVDVRL